MKYPSNLLSFIVLAVFAAFIPGTAAAEKQEAAGQAYQAAHKLILEEKYPAAIQALQAFLEKYGSSDWADDARFWICFAREKTEPSGEKSFDCYQRFIQANPKSEWVDDAKLNTVRIAHALAKEGKPQYEAQVRSFAGAGEGEFEMAVLAALLDIGDEGSIPKVLDRIDHIPNEEVRAKMVRMLGDQAESPAVMKKLAELARKDPSQRVRESAIWALADTDRPEALAVLKETALSADSLELRKRAIRALADMHESYSEILPLLKGIAEKDPNLELALTAVGALGDMESREAYQALQAIYSTSNVAEVRKAAVRTIVNIGGNDQESTQFLLNVVTTDSNPEIQRAAVSALADIETPEALAALKEIVGSNRDMNLREAALRAIGDQSGEKSVEMLAAILKSEKDARLRGAAILALGDTGRDAAVPALEQAAKSDPDPQLRTAAVHALREIGTPAAREALLRLISK